MGEPPLFEELAIYKSANARLIEAIERQQDQLAEAASTLQALAGENDKLARTIERQKRQAETSRKFWIEAADAALTVLPCASNSTHPAYDLWLRTEMAKMPPMEIVLSDARPTREGGE